MSERKEAPAYVLPKPRATLGQQILSALGQSGGGDAGELTALVCGIDRCAQLLEQILQAVTGVEHGTLEGREAADQHPISAITDLEQTLEGKLETTELAGLSNMEIEKALSGADGSDPDVQEEGGST